MSDVTTDGERLIQAWAAAQNRLQRTRSEVVSAECEVVNTQTALAKWLLPDDAVIGEKIAVWWIDNLVQVELLEHQQYRVTIRKRGRRGL